MFDAILNKIAERSQAIKDKDAEIAVWQETAMEQESRINSFIEDSKTYSTRIREKQASLDGAEARAEAAELQLMQIAEALEIEAGPAGALGQAMAEIEANVREQADAVQAQVAEAMVQEPSVEEAAEAPATEG